MSVLAGVTGIAGLFVLRAALDAADDVIARHRSYVPVEHAGLTALARGRPAVLEPARAGNAAVVLEAVLAAIDRIPEADRMPLEDAGDPPSAAATALVDDHPEVVAALEPILFVPSDPPDVGLGARAFGESVWRFADAWRWLDVAAARRPGERSAARARHVALLMGAFANEVERRGTPLHRFLGLGIEAAALRRLRLALEDADLGVDEARDAGRVLDALDHARLPLSTTVAVSRAGDRALFCRAASDSNTLLVGARGFDLATLGFGGGLRRLLPRKVLIAHTLASWDPALDRVGTALGIDDADGRARLARVEAAARDDDDLVEASLRHWPRLLRAETGVRARVAVLRGALAVAEDAARRGVAPPGWSDLVPGVLPAVPLDPWDGSPLRTDGTRVWSVGPDGRDDGGTTTDPDADTGDVVVTVPRTPAPSRAAGAAPASAGTGGGR